MTKEIIDAIGTMTILQLSELVKEIEEKYKDT
jgi:ribosomal protein L7/L12